MEVQYYKYWLTGCNTMWNDESGRKRLRLSTSLSWDDFSSIEDSQDSNQKRTHTPLTRSKYNAKKQKRADNNTMPYLGKIMPVNVVNRLVSKFVPPIPEVKNPYEDILLSSPEKPKLRIREYYPTQSKPTEPLPTIFYVPGTAFTHSPKEASHRICGQLAIKTGCQVIRLDHSLAPKHTYEVAADQIFDSYKHIMENPDYFNVDPDKVAIAGYSSGGFLAALTALRAVEENLTVPNQILISPIIDLSPNKSRKYSKFEDKDTIVTQAYVNAFLSKCKPPNQDEEDCLSPLKYSEKAFQRLPRVDMIVSENDRFRGDAHAYNDQLKAYHVPHTLEIIKGKSHAYLWRTTTSIDKLAGIILKSLQLLKQQKKQNAKLKRTLKSSSRKGASRALFANPPPSKRTKPNKEKLVHIQAQEHKDLYPVLCN